MTTKEILIITGVILILVGLFCRAERNDRVLNSLCADNVNKVMIPCGE